MRWTGLPVPNTVADMEQIGQQNTYVTCRCQNCDGGIEFDALTFAKGETRTIECPHCRLETIIFTPPPTAPSVSPKNKFTPLQLKANVLWAITAALFVILLCLHGAPSESSDAFTFFSVICVLLMIGFFIAAILTTDKIYILKHPRKPPTPKWICANCGILSIWKQNACQACGEKSAIPLETPRGGELFATYHGTVTAKERIEIGDDVTKKLLHSLEPILASGSIAIELEKLATLVQTGAITTDEWQRAKNLYLGQPEGKKREHALKRIRELYDLQQSGAVSESEFNAVKWDILSRGVV